MIAEYPIDAIFTYTLGGVIHTKNKNIVELKISYYLPYIFFLPKIDM